MYPIQQHFAEQDLGGFKLEYIVQSSPLVTAGGTKSAQEHQEERAYLGLRYGYIYTGSNWWRLSRLVRA
jgi:NDP-sugar pyrophosphorylase family protein